MKKLIVFLAFAIIVGIALFILFSSPENPDASLPQLIHRNHQKVVAAFCSGDREALKKLVVMSQLGVNEASVKANIENRKKDVWEYTQEDVVYFLRKDDRVYVVLPWRDSEHGVSSKRIPYNVFVYINKKGAWLFECGFGVNPNVEKPTPKDWEETLFPDISDLESIRLEHQ